MKFQKIAEKLIMLDDKTLTRIATKELIAILGKEYLRSDYCNTCRDWGTFGDDKG